MGRLPRRITQDQRHSVYPGARSAVCVLADAFDGDLNRAREVLRVLIDAGFFIATREPSNAMLEAYLSALGRPAKDRGVILNNIGKAKKRWQAMGQAGTSLAMAFGEMPDQSKDTRP